jgi:large-conductance mechanosensitive channel
VVIGLGIFLIIYCIKKEKKTETDDEKAEKDLKKEMKRE